MSFPADVLQLTVLGPASVRIGDDPVTGFATGKTQALLFYLAVTGQPHRRAALAGLLWPETTESKAKKNLRDALSNLRKLAAPYLVITRQTVAFDRDSSYRLDVESFTAALETGDIPTIQEAIKLYRGDFLAGFYVRDASAFEEWVLVQRERLHGVAIQALHTLSRHYAAQGAAGRPAALDYTSQLLALEPWREESHRQMMTLLAHSGQRSAALAQYETCRQVLAGELGTEPLPETTALYERLKAAETAPPHNLPPQPTLFIGRDAELAQIKQYLERPVCRLVTIAGPGGVGKTRLALRAASDEVKQFLHGVFWVALASLDSPGQLVPALAEAVGLAFRGTADPKAQLLDYLQTKEMLLALDNFEHLIAEIGLLIDILTTAPEVKLLVTSRERLNLQEEWVLELEGLPYPGSKAGRTGRPDRRPDSQRQPPDDAVFDLTTSDIPQASPDEAGPTAAQIRSPNFETYSAIELFAQRARQTRADFTLSEENMRHVIHICRLVKGLPLAIELAAGWLRLLSCAEIVAEIEQNLDFLTAASRNVPDRHRSLRAVFDQSWRLLSAQPQAIYAKLSIFRGGFQREAAEQVAQASLPVLAGLADKSLLRRTPSGRYEIHELLRQYAAEKLAAQEVDITQIRLPQEEDAAISTARLKHSLYYMEFLSSREAELNGGSPQQAVREIKSELDNIRSGWYWTVASPVVWNWVLTAGKTDQIEQGISSLASFYDITGLFQEGADGFGRAADRVREILAVGSVPSQPTRMIIGRLLAAQAHLLNQQGHYSRAILVARTAVDLAQPAGATGVEAMARHQWGKALVGEGNYPAAQTQLEQALTLARQAEQSRLEAEILRRLGILATHQNDYLTAQDVFEQALMLFHDLENLRGRSLVLNNLGIVAQGQNDYVAAQSAYLAALHCFREIEDAWGETMALNNLGEMAYVRGDYTAAQTAYQQALRLSHELEDRINEGIILENLGHLFCKVGIYARARDYYDQSLQLRRKIGDQLGEGQTLAGLALLHHYLGDNETAWGYSRQAHRIGRKLDSQALQAAALTHTGHALLAQGQFPEAVAAYRQALELRQQLGQTQQALEARAGLVRTLLAQGEIEQAARHGPALLPHLKAEALYGVEEPFRIHLTCYQLLRTIQDPQAQAVLVAAHRLLLDQAATIKNRELRRSFLEKVPAHREISRAYKHSAGALDGER